MPKNYPLVDPPKLLMKYPLSTPPPRPPIFLLPDLEYRNNGSKSVVPPTKLEKKFLRRDELAERITKLTPRWKKARSIFKQFDWELGQCICEHQDLDRELFEIKPGITYCKSYVMSDGRRKKKVAKVKDVLELTKTIPEAMQLELFYKLQNQFEEGQDG